MNFKGRLLAILDIAGICTLLFSALQATLMEKGRRPLFFRSRGGEEFFKSLMDLYRYNAPFNPSLVPFMFADWWKEVTDRGGLKRAKGGAYLLSEEAKPLGGRLCRTFAVAPLPFAYPQNSHHRQAQGRVRKGVGVITLNSKWIGKCAE